MKKITLFVSVAVLISVSGESVENKNSSSITADEGSVGTPWLPFFGSFPSFMLAGLRRPSVARDTIRATKTEYREVTRKTTVHPMCYIMHKQSGPCLPHRSHDEDERNEALIESEMSGLMRPVKEVYMEEERDGKYLRFGNRAKPQLEGSEIHPARRATEYVSTTTVLVTRLEKYMDRRVTATMIALNCQPIDPSMEECPKRAQRPILDVPIIGNVRPNSIIITPVKPKSEPIEDEIDRAVEAVKAAIRAEEDTANVTETA